MRGGGGGGLSSSSAVGEPGSIGLQPQQAGLEPGAVVPSPVGGVAPADLPVEERGEGDPAQVGQQEQARRPVHGQELRHGGNQSRHQQDAGDHGSPEPFGPEEERGPCQVQSVVREPHAEGEGEGGEEKEEAGGGGGGGGGGGCGGAQEHPRCRHSHAPVQDGPYRAEDSVGRGPGGEVDLPVPAPSPGGGNDEGGAAAASDDVAGGPGHGGGKGCQAGGGGAGGGEGHRPGGEPWAAGTGAACGGGGGGGALDSLRWGRECQGRLARERQQGNCSCKHCSEGGHGDGDGGRRRVWNVEGAPRERGREREREGERGRRERHCVKDLSIAHVGISTIGTQARRYTVGRAQK